MVSNTTDAERRAFEALAVFECLAADFLAGVFFSGLETVEKGINFRVLRQREERTKNKDKG